MRSVIGFLVLWFVFDVGRVVGMVVVLLFVRFGFVLKRRDLMVAGNASRVRTAKSLSFWCLFMVMLTLRICVKLKEKVKTSLLKERHCGIVKLNLNLMLNLESRNNDIFIFFIYTT
jgi:hypothetical protein